MPQSTPGALTPTRPPTPAPPRGAQRQSLSTTNNTTVHYVNPQCGTTPTNAIQPLLQPGEVLVGWNFSQGARCGIIYRSGIWFRDIAKSASVVDATLTFYVSRSQSSAQGNPLTGNVSCTAELQTASAMWMNNPNNPNALLGTPYLTFPADRPNDTETFGPFTISNGMFISVDVTQAVRQWAAGTQPNYGFVLVPAQSNFSGGAGRCFSAYNGFTLTVDTK
ncbi:MAG: DNRLRE domain-containing protein [Candidatus Eremiobacteraeota bacterium]|nr:DNRLRE domain-containing protein [Candidatus Eremiobacteraeota bacterium]